jgi:hypothetical protein
MDLGQIQTGIESWLNLTAVDANEDPVTALPVEFLQQPNKVQTKPFVGVRIGTIVKLGHDNKTYTHNELTDEYIEQMWGNRRMTLRLLFRSFDQRWNYNARQFAEDWRGRTQKPESIAALGDVGLSLWGSIGELIETDILWSGKLISQVATDVTLGLWGYERTPRTDTGYIKNVNIEGRAPVIDTNVTQVVDQDGEAVVTGDVITINVTTE